MAPKFTETMKQLGLRDIDDKFFINNDVTLADRTFNVLVQVGDKKCILHVGEHPAGVYDLERPVITKHFDYSDEAGMAIYFTLSTTFMQEHLHKEFQNFVKEHAA